jgi:hypothetical protein
MRSVARSTRRHSREEPGGKSSLRYGLRAGSARSANGSSGGSTRTSRVRLDGDAPPEERGQRPTASPWGRSWSSPGILPLTRPSAGLATVLGHEVAHAHAEHVAERLEREKLTDRGGDLAGGIAVTPAQYVPRPWRARCRRSGDFAPVTTANRSTEAEHIGLIYMDEGGVRPTPGRGLLEADASAPRRARSRRSSPATIPAPLPGSSRSRAGNRNAERAERER